MSQLDNLIDGEGVGGCRGPCINYLPSVGVRNF